MTKSTALLFAAAAASSLSGASALSQADTLLRFFSLANGNHWKESSGWKEYADAVAAGNATASVDVCQWHGIICEQMSDGEMILTGIDLTNNNLSGEVAHHLWSLPHLRVVILSGNSLEDAGLLGFAADFATPSPIETLDLSENRLMTVEGISSVPSTLRDLDIGSNAFEGDFPEEIYRLKHIKYLKASYNAGFTGTISTEIGNLSNLRELSLSFTNIKGSIPTEIGGLSLLEFLSLDNNRLKGNLPPSLEGLSSLKYLSITNSESEEGAVTGPLLSFRDNINLKELYLNNNALTGTIPDDLLHNSLLVEKDVMVNLAYNRLNGKLPTGIGRFERLHIEAEGNRFSGIPNELCHRSKWNHHAVSLYGCDAILCPKGTYASTGRRESEEEGCVACPGGVTDAPHYGSVNCSGGSGGSGGSGASSSSDVQSTTSTKSTSTYQPPSSSTSESSGMSGGAKFAVIFFSLSAVLALAVLGRREMIKRAHVKAALEEAELERQVRNGVVMDAADADGMTDVRLGGGTGSSGPASPGVDRCIL